MNNLFWEFFQSLDKRPWKNLHLGEIYKVLNHINHKKWFPKNNNESTIYHPK